MDLYRDVISDEKGEHINGVITDRDGEDSENQPAKQAKLDTDALSPPRPEDDAEEIPPPTPDATIEEYSSARLEQGLCYIKEAATDQDITPRTRKLLRLHKDAYEIALSGEASDAAALAVVQALDKVYHSEALYSKPRVSKDWESYVKLRRREFYANYGPYMNEDERSMFANLEKDFGSTSVESQEAQK